MWFLLLFYLMWLASCEQNYCDICVDHTMCKFGEETSQRCGRNSLGGVSKIEIEKILKVHNEYRTKVANGYENRGLLGPQPSAANMQMLVWDQKLAEIAQRWADQCTLLHDNCRDDYRFPVGQNIYWSSGKMNVNWTRAIETWYNEVDYVDSRTIEKYTFSEGNYETGHYVQLVWAKTRYIGCGRRSYKNSYRLRSNRSFEFILSEKKEKVKKASVDELGYFGGATFDPYGAEGALTHSWKDNSDIKNVSTMGTYFAYTPYYDYSGYISTQLILPSAIYPAHISYYYPYTKIPIYKEYADGSTDKESTNELPQSLNNKPINIINEEVKRNITIPSIITVNDQYYDLSNDEILICNYGPTGMVIEEPIYEIGTPCSKCFTDNNICQNGLCV